MSKQIESVLVANRGEIALRIINTVHKMGMRAVAVYSEVDAALPFVSAADDAVMIGPPPAAKSYLNTESIIDAAHTTNCDAVHPGYGFLSESSDFARSIRDADLVWIGPTPVTIRAMGDKINARNLMSAAGVPVAGGTTEPVEDLQRALAEAARIGYPVMVKASAGGGGIGMVVAENAASLTKALDGARDRAARFFGDPAILLERYIPNARHVEVQILGLGDGRVFALGERDCSVQRRHQKVVEETPSPGISEDLRSRLLNGAIRAAEAIDYVSAGTVECLVDPDAQEFVFLEMNTRLQVEHPITELVTGVDLVEEQLRIAAGEKCSFEAPPTPHGHAIEFRVYAEDPQKFMPSPGTINQWVAPTGTGVRLDAGYSKGNEVSPFYDPLLAKLCIYGDDRSEALSRARDALEAFTIEGITSNLPFLREIVNNPEFISGVYDTGIIDRMRSNHTNAVKPSF